MNIFKTSAITIIATFFLIGRADCAFSDFEETFSNNPEKLQEWSAMATEVDKWCDALGKPIDSGVKETVIILNLLGFKTSGSCEGHLDRGCPYPWIDFENQRDELLQNKITKIQEQIKEQQNSKNYKQFIDLMDQAQELSVQLNQCTQKDNLLQNKIDEVLELIREYRNSKEHKQLDDLFAHNRMVFLQLEQNMQNGISPIYSLLEKFYAQKNIDYDQIIHFHDKYYARIESIGTNKQCIRSPDEKKNMLEKYQEEMNKFTDFLIQEYLEK